MRVHFCIAEANDTSAEIHFLADNLKEESVIAMSFDKQGDLYVFAAMGIGSLPNREIVRVMRQLSGTLGDIKAGGKEPTADAIIKALSKEHGKQVVFDERQDKYRNVSTMRDGENLYKAVGINGTTVVVSAEDEKKATNRLVNKITQMMVSSPDKATELAAWFADGRKVEEAESGKCPETIPLTVLGGVYAEEKKTLKTKKTTKKPN